VPFGNRWGERQIVRRPANGRTEKTNSCAFVSRSTTSIASLSRRVSLHSLTSIGNEHRPRRCHRTTVSGRTTCKELRQFFQRLDSTTHQIRSISVQPRPWLTRFPHGELLPQSEILQRQLAARANRGANHDRPNSRSVRTTQDRCDRRVFRRDNRLRLTDTTPGHDRQDHRARSHMLSTRQSYRSTEPTRLAMSRSFPSGRAVIAAIAGQYQEATAEYGRKYGWRHRTSRVPYSPVAHRYSAVFGRERRVTNERRAAPAAAPRRRVGRRVTTPRTRCAR
jgi:hypothetical protein